MHIGLAQRQRHVGYDNKRMGIDREVLPGGVVDEISKPALSSSFRAIACDSSWVLEKAPV